VTFFCGTQEKILCRMLVSKKHSLRHFKNVELIKIHRDIPPNILQIFLKEEGQSLRFETMRVIQL